MHGLPQFPRNPQSSDASGYKLGGLREVPYHKARTFRVRTPPGEDGRLRLMPFAAWNDQSNPPAPARPFPLPSVPPESIGSKCSARTSVVCDERRHSSIHGSNHSPFRASITESPHTGITTRKRLLALPRLQFLCSDALTPCTTDANPNPLKAALNVLQNVT